MNRTGRSRVAPGRVRRFHFTLNRRLSRMDSRTRREESLSWTVLRRCARPDASSGGRLTMEAWLSCIALGIRTLCESLGERGTSGTSSASRRSRNRSWWPLKALQPAYAYAPGARRRSVKAPVSRSASWFAMFPGGRGRPSFFIAVRSCRAAFRAMWRRATLRPVAPSAGRLS